jgi:hypothetical protein
MVQFVAELRKLFSLMLKSKRKAINPSQTLRCLRNCSKYDVDTFNQEDVSEFATILVNLLEESFDIMYKIQQKQLQPVMHEQQQQQQLKQEQQLDDSISTSFSTLTVDNADSGSKKTSEPVNSLSASDKLNLRKNRKNPIVNLLNGDVLINRKNSGKILLWSFLLRVAFELRSTKKTFFKQYPKSQTLKDLFFKTFQWHRITFRAIRKKYLFLKKQGSQIISRIVSVILTLILLKLTLIRKKRLS